MPQACSREQLWAKSSALIFRAYILAMLNKLYIYIYMSCGCTLDVFHAWATNHTGQSKTSIPGI